MVVFLVTSPTSFEFSGLLAVFTYVLGAVHLILTVLTADGIGPFNIIPFPIHGTIEAVVGVVLIILAYTLFKDNDAGKLFYVIFGTVLLLTWFVTDYKGVIAKPAQA